MKALIAVDFSPESERTLKAVGTWASTWGVEVHLFTVVRPGEVHDTAASRPFIHSFTPAGTSSGQALGATEPLPSMVETRTQAFTRIETEAAEQLMALAREYLPLAYATAHVEVSDGVAQRIVARAAELRADLIVMGTHGRTGLSHAIVGSVAESVIRVSAVPVLVVGPAVNSD